MFTEYIKEKDCLISATLMPGLWEWDVISSRIDMIMLSGLLYHGNILRPVYYLSLKFRSSNCGPAKKAYLLSILYNFQLISSDQI